MALLRIPHLEYHHFPPLTLQKQCLFHDLKCARGKEVHHHEVHVQRQFRSKFGVSPMAKFSVPINCLTITEGTRTMDVAVRLVRATARRYIAPSPKKCLDGRRHELLKSAITMILFRGMSAEEEYALSLLPFHLPNQPIRGNNRRAGKQGLEGTLQF